MNNLYRSPYTALDSVLIQLQEGASDVLAGGLVGVYLQGSLAIGDFDEHSDVDFLVVTEEELTQSQIDSLGKLHLEISSQGSRHGPNAQVMNGSEEVAHWSTSLEGSYIPRPALWRYEGVQRELWYIDNGSRTLERSTHDDTLVVRWTLRERGIALSGPHPRTLVDTVSSEDLDTEVLARLRQVAGQIIDGPEEDRSFWNSGFGQPYAVVSICRMLQTLETGDIESKQAAAVWSLQALDAQWSSLIQSACEQRGKRTVSQPAITGEFEKTCEFARYALDLCRCGQRRPAMV